MQPYPSLMINAALAQRYTRFKEASNDDQGHCGGTSGRMAILQLMEDFGAYTLSWPPHSFLFTDLCVNDADVELPVALPEISGVGVKANTVGRMGSDSRRGTRRSVGRVLRTHVNRCSSPLAGGLLPCFAPLSYESPRPSPSFIGVLRTHSPTCSVALSPVQPSAEALS
jgi:hypothetical protein